MSLSGNLIAQELPNALGSTNLQRSILQKAENLDSFILWDKSSYWKDDFKISGLAFKDRTAYKLTIKIKNKPNNSIPKVDRFSLEEIRETGFLNGIKFIDLNKLIVLNTDSLNLKSRTNSYLTVSDAPYWTMLILKNKEIYLKESYAPKFYQKGARTEERDVFIKIFTNLDELNIL